MKNFLKKYLTDDQLKELETKYITEHPEAKELPVYISKTRLDEVIGQKKTAEDLVTSHTATIKKIQDDQSKALDDAKKDWEKVKGTEIDTLKKDFETTEAIYKSKGRNVKAIKALIDPTKKIDEEITRLQKDEAYLFQSGKDGDGLPPGTGKKEPTDAGNEEKENAAMRRAVGI